MSSGYGYYRIDFYKKDGTPDEVKAKEAFDWCSQQYDWFTKEEPFILENNKILWNERKYADGLPLKSSFYKVPNCDAALEDPIRTWIQEMGDAVKAEVIAGGFLCDYSESDDDANYNLSIIYKDGEIIFSDIVAFNRSLHAASNYGVYYALNPDNHYYRGLFRNKMTGKELFSGYVALDSDSDDDEDSDGEYLCRFVYYNDGDIDDDEPFLCDADGYIRISYGDEFCGFDHFNDEDYDIIEHFIKDEVEDEPEKYGDLADWEFIGISGEPDVFELVKRL